jgi:FkbM family methyltransferase
MKAALANALRPISVIASQLRGTGLPRISEALRRRHQRRWHGGEVTIDDFQGGIRMAVDPAEHMGSYIYWFDAYSRGEIRLIRRLLQLGQCFVDVGANIGEFTLVAAQCVGRTGHVISFEPVPQIRARLKRNVALNNFSWVEIRPEALGNEAREVELFSGDYDGEFHLGLPTAFRSDERRDRIATAELVTLDEMWPELGTAGVAGMKLDIEGGELAALKGAEGVIDRHRPWIICEIGKDTCEAAGYEAGDVFAWFVRHGYSISRVDEDGRLRALSTAEHLNDWQNVFARPSGLDDWGAN